MAQGNVDVTVSNVTVNMVKYNLHGRFLLTDLCNDCNNFIIAIQEHWLPPNGLHEINDIHPDYFGTGVSAMTNKLNHGIYRGRPFGGVAFLWRKAIADGIRVIGNDPDGRCLCIELQLANQLRLKLINVYLPCYSSGAILYL